MQLLKCGGFSASARTAGLPSALLCAERILLQMIETDGQVEKVKSAGSVHTSDSRDGFNDFDRRRCGRGGEYRRDEADAAVAPIARESVKLQLFFRKPFAFAFDSFSSGDQQVIVNIEDKLAEGISHEILKFLD